MGKERIGILAQSSADSLTPSAPSSYCQKAQPIAGTPITAVPFAGQLLLIEPSEEVRVGEAAARPGRDLSGGAPPPETQHHSGPYPSAKLSAPASGPGRRMEGKADKASRPLPGLHMLMALFMSMRRTRFMGRVRPGYRPKGLSRSALVRRRQPTIGFHRRITARCPLRYPHAHRAPSEKLAWPLLLPSASESEENSTK